jgi:hypothetical protein
VTSNYEEITVVLFENILYCLCKIRCETEQNGSEKEQAIKELISRAKALTMDIEDFLMAVENVIVTGESRKKGSEFLNTASKTILELHMVIGVNVDPLILSLRQAKVRLSKRLAESDAATAAAASPPPPPQRPSYYGDADRDRRGSSEALEAIARAQIKFEMGQLCDETLCDVSPTAKLQAD